MNAYKKSMIKGFIVTLWAGGALLTLGSAEATIIANYADFTGACGSSTLTCVGNATTVGSVLRVAPASSGQSGAAYSTTPVTLGSNAIFSTTFQFQFTQPGGIDPADGITFVLANNSSGLGGAGGGIGYQGVANSVAIEFDTYNNGGGDNNSSNEVGVDVNGSLSSVTQANPYGVATCDFGISTNYTNSGCMSNGGIWTATIGYDGSNLTVKIQDGANAAQTIINAYGINISSFLGTNIAYVGFTSATGSGWENHDILNWQFANDTSLAPPPSVPEPDTFAIFSIGLIGLGFSHRRRRS
jgi:hypothetical protein